MTNINIIRIIAAMAAAGTSPERIQAYLESLDDLAEIDGAVAAAAPAPLPVAVPRDTRPVIVFADGTTGRLGENDPTEHWTR